MTSLEHKFETVYNANYSKVIRLCLGYTNGDSILAKDLTQDVFIKVWEHFELFRNQSSISTWIYRITVNTCLLELRKKKKTVRLSSQRNEPEQSNDDFLKDNETKLKQLYTCISHLNSENRSIILLELEGLPQKEIAEIMGLSHETIRVRIHRIKNELTKCVKK
ncbi:RNA polymerase sigma factor [Psychroserpens algicola]|uniref:RNA polymerase sigma factor n=1 Tax=Psychroserpens algicola TaxID=1719034 RepID=A0ABT0HDF4_9FLAO|nr:RNA polymerase sigma factor [Psychroserpens algicola]MCK8481822.1 RNA polymerase sigma factor [Psychroserpens algicola]